MSEISIKHIRHIEKPRMSLVEVDGEPGVMVSASTGRFQIWTKETDGFQALYNLATGQFAPKGEFEAVRLKEVQ